MPIARGFLPSGPPMLFASASARCSDEKELEIAYVCELNHLPGTYGKLVYSRADAAWIEPHRDARIQRKAECFAEPYLVRSPRQAP